jgi:hypothetical protein
MTASTIGLPQRPFANGEKTMRWLGMSRIALVAVAASIVVPTADVQASPSGRTRIIAQVGIGTPDCHIQGTLWRMANNCPPEAIARARQEHPIEHGPYRSYSGSYQDHSAPYWHHRYRHAHRYHHNTPVAIAH